MASKKLTMMVRGKAGLRCDLYDAYVSSSNCVAHLFLNLYGQRKRDDYLVQLAHTLAAAPALKAALRQIKNLGGTYAAWKEAGTPELRAEIADRMVAIAAEAFDLTKIDGLDQL